MPDDPAPSAIPIAERREVTARYRKALTAWFENVPDAQLEYAATALRLARGLWNWDDGEIRRGAILEMMQDAGDGAWTQDEIAESIFPFLARRWTRLLEAANPTSPDLISSLISADALALCHPPTQSPVSVAT